MEDKGGSFLELVQLSNWRDIKKKKKRGGGKEDTQPPPVLHTIASNQINSLRVRLSFRASKELWLEMRYETHTIKHTHAHTYYAVESCDRPQTIAIL